MVGYRVTDAGASVRFRRGALGIGWHPIAHLAAGEQLAGGYREKIAAGAPARKRVDGQQVFSCFLMRKIGTRYTKPGNGGRNNEKTEAAAGKGVLRFWQSKDRISRRQQQDGISCCRKEIGSGDMTADERRRKAINEYYSKYREYQKLDNVREHMRVEISGDTLIEIHRYYGERKGERVLRVTQEEAEEAEVTAEVAAYEQAADQLDSMIKSRRESLETRQKTARKVAG